MITFATGCSGIGAPEVALGDRLGWRCLWNSEIEAFPAAVLKHHWPEVPNVGDFMTIAGRIDRNELEAPDVFVAGTPCQAFSVAGLRGSLNDKRGGLTLEYCRIADAMDRQRRGRGLPETIFLWENVPGVLNTKDNAFGCFLSGLSGSEEPLVPGGKRWTNAGAVLGSARSLAWRILDAQYFGVAQRRRRVFVVATARAGFSPAGGLFEFGGLPRNNPPSREAGKEAPGAAGSGFAETGFGVWRDYERGGTLRTTGTVPSNAVYCIGNGQAAEAAAMLTECSQTLNCMHDPQAICQYGDIAGALTSRYDGSPCADRGPNIILEKV